ncbi:hypothetical protein BG000_003063 [Podila horticola]|nr:hypothetical protein BG000_003063 [Podila horticola]
MNLPHSKFNSVLGTEFSQLNSETSKQNDAFCNSEWGPEAAEEMCKQVRDLKIPGGKDGNLTMGDLIDKTPKHLISKVMLEEKLNPSGGAGALTAIHDAVALANWISTLHKPRLADIDGVFAEYQAERLPVAKEAVGTTKFFKSMGGKGIVSALSKSLFRHMPEWLIRIVRLKMVAARPQLSFLPLVKDKGSIPPKYQPSLEKTLPILKERAARKLVVATPTDATVAV